MTARSFTTSTQDQADLPGIPFTLEGVYRKGTAGPDGATTWSEDFTLSAVVEAKLAGIITSAFILHNGQEIVNPDVTLQFFYLALEPESATRFRQLVQDDRRLVAAQVLGEVFFWAAEQMTGLRPTQ